MKYLLPILLTATAMTTAVSAQAQSQAAAIGTPAQAQTIHLPISNNPEITYGEAVSRHEFGIDTGIFRSPEKRVNMRRILL